MIAFGAVATCRPLKPRRCAVGRPDLPAGSDGEAMPRIAEPVDEPGRKTGRGTAGRHGRNLRASSVHRWNRHRCERRATECAVLTAGARTKPGVKLPTPVGTTRRWEWGRPQGRPHFRISGRSVAAGPL